MNEGTDIGADSAGTEGDSPVITELRKRLREAEKQAAAAADQVTAFNQAKAEAVQNLVDGFGFPKLADTVLDKVDGFPTPEKVGAVLADLGLAEFQAPADEPEATPPAANLQQVAGLGQRAASAASDKVDPLTDLNEARTREELLDAVRKAGLVF